MRIVVDAMGSDNAPSPEVEGAVKASLKLDVEVILVGDEALLRPALDTYPKRGNVRIVHASQAITMEDNPVMAVRKKKDASVLVGLRLVKNGEADAMISAGNTGAVHVASRTIVGPIRGVARSAIATILPTLGAPVLLLDMGANVDCAARHLIDFAEMGMVYAERVLGVERPRVALLNIGAEVLKGNEVAKAVHAKLTDAEHINFIGNIEPKRLYEGRADVVVCDGFVGNVFLKTSEGAAWVVSRLVARELKATLISMLGALLSRGAFKRIRRIRDPNEHPGAPLLGVKGVVIITHGGCNSKGVANAIKGAHRAVETNLIGHIRSGIEELRSERGVAQEAKT
jgi:phosphate acyltransferase